jgi:HD-GYP domain-containing protein (c-di-GMP phosphodiesterase class II)
VAEAFGWQTIRSRLEEFHELVRGDLPGVLRIGVAILERDSGLLRTFLHSTVGPPPFLEYALPLAECPSLTALATSRADRVLDDLDGVADPPAWHSRALRDRGFRSSYTRPFYRAGRLAGFLFFDAAVPGYFTAGVVRRLRFVADQLAMVVLHGLDVVQVLEAALRTSTLLTRFRDHETAEHVERVSRYARLVAQEMAGRWGLADDVVEAIALFSVVHDVGKVAIPESLLGKPGPLAPDEMERMKAHTTAGVAIVDGIVADLGLQDHEHLGILHNVVRSHHELLDGSGYPDGLAGDAIPPEARIIVVADVYDALRSERPYKAAWSHDEALAYLAAARGTLFEPACVDALLAHATALQDIRRRVDDR